MNRYNRYNHRKIISQYEYTVCYVHTNIYKAQPRRAQHASISMSRNLK